MNLANKCSHISKMAQTAVGQPTAVIDDILSSDTEQWNAVIYYRLENDEGELNYVVYYDSFGLYYQALRHLLECDEIGSEMKKEVKMELRRINKEWEEAIKL